MAETTYNNLIVQALQDQQEAVDALAAARAAIAAAITAKGVSTPASTRFNAMAAKINSIKLGATIATGTINLPEHNPRVINVPCNFTPSMLILFTLSQSYSGYHTDGHFFYLYYDKTATVYNSGINETQIYPKSASVDALVPTGGILAVQAPSFDAGLGNYYDEFYGSSAKANGYDNERLIWKWYAIK